MYDLSITLFVRKIKIKHKHTVFYISKTIALTFIRGYCYSCKFKNINIIHKYKIQNALAKFQLVINYANMHVCERVYAELTQLRAIKPSDYR